MIDFPAGTDRKMPWLTDGNMAWLQSL